MKKLALNRGLFIIVLVIFSFAGIKAQDSNSDKYVMVAKEQHPTVINTKMIERFNSIYNEIEVVPWFDIMSTKTFEETKNYLTAYKNIKLDEIHPKEVYKELTQLKEKIENEPIIETEYKNHASVD